MHAQTVPDIVRSEIISGSLEAVRLRADDLHTAPIATLRATYNPIGSHEM